MSNEAKLEGKLWIVKTKAGRIIEFAYHHYNEMERCAANYLKFGWVTINGRKIKAWGQTWVWAE